MDYQLLVASEMQAFAEALLAAQQGAATEAQLQKAHAKLYRFTDPARDRFVQLQNQDPDQAEAFRASLRDYVRAYGFLAQIVGYADPELERLYLYGRALLLRLPHPPSPGVDTGETTLSHLRIDRTGAGNYSLTPEGPQEIAGFRADGGARAEVEEVPLSEVIAELNERFGFDLGTSDRIIIGQQIASLVEDPQLQAVAAVEDLERFGQVADPKLDRLVGELLDANERFVGRYFDNPEFQAAVKQIARRRAYDIILSPARDEALRRLKESSSSGRQAT